MSTTTKYESCNDEIMPFDFSNGSETKIVLHWMMTAGRKVPWWRGQNISTILFYMLKYFFIEYIIY